MKNDLCCICLKDEPFKNDEIAHCNDENCKTIVHKACYDIQRLVDGSWLCQKCVSLEKSSRGLCELCPSDEGTLIKTNKGGCCHIVCALFVPGVVFLDRSSLENVSLENVTYDKSKVCFICQNNNRLDRATIGVCIKCKKGDCEVSFHVTCGQSEGLLKEVGTPRDGIQYVAYCYLHIQTAKRRRFTMCLSKINNHTNLSDGKESQPSITNGSSSNKEIRTSSSSDFLRQDDLSAPEIKENKVNSNIPVKGITDESQLERLQSPDKAITETQTLSHNCLIPKEIGSSEDFGFIAKEEIKTEEPITLSSLASADIQTKLSNEPTLRASKRQAAMATSDIFQKKEKVLKSEQKPRCKSRPIKSTTKSEKVKRAKKIPNTTQMKNENRTSKKYVGPSIPKSMFDHINSIVSGYPGTIKSTSISSPLSASNTTKVDSVNCQSMEELLEWQWNQTGSLLMKQSEPEDIASLLSCLHEIKTENETLISKQLKLLQRKDHLKTINARLQIQLLAKPVESDNGSFTNGSNSIQACPKVIQKKVISDKPQIPIKPSVPGCQFNNGVMRPPPISESSSSVIPMWNQTLYRHNQADLDQYLSHQTLAQRQQCQYQQHSIATPISQPVSSGLAMTSLMPTTDLATRFNNQIHSHKTGNSLPEFSLKTFQSKSLNQDFNLSSNNGQGLFYQSLPHTAQQPRYQPQTLHTSNIYNQTASKYQRNQGME